ncbi:UNVERIFIED_CONTAM: hypothetical protein Sradi_6472400 [Sesamum radiatum]|uniref:Uncharacterized protein n=1 Tax=Sesamum radiatum TaxID=300843 RepID=A0AAW2K5S7_SESRA
MLSKQLWRLMQKLDCLDSFILKSRYFPDLSPLEAGFRTWPSLVWRSIINSRDLVRTGCRWRVKVKVWDDPWLPWPVSFKVVEPMFEGCEDIQVATLIDPITKQ